MDLFGGIDDFDEWDCEGVEDVEFDRKVAEQLYRTQMYTTSPIRWERARTDIQFDDLIDDLYGQRHNVISCPFHGRDSKPSFNIYRRTNDAYCFGCPDGHRYYDTVRLVAAHFGIGHKEALEWLERKYELPPIADVAAEHEEEEISEEVELTYDDLTRPYIDHARTQVREVLKTVGSPAKATELRRLAQFAEGFLLVYFRAEPMKGGAGADPLPLAEVLGLDRIEALLVEKDS